LSQIAGEEQQTDENISSKSFPFSTTAPELRNVEI